MRIVPAYIGGCTCDEPRPGVVEAEREQSANKFAEREEEGDGYHDEGDGDCCY